MVLGRIDVFWMGAGGFLTLFGTNEVIAYATHAVPRWLGGPLALAGEIVAIFVGLAVMYGLGIREPNPKDAPSIDLRRARGSVSQTPWHRSSTNSRP